MLFASKDHGSRSNGCRDAVTDIMSADEAGVLPSIEIPCKSSLYPTRGVRILESAPAFAFQEGPGTGGTGIVCKGILGAVKPSCVRLSSLYRTLRLVGTAPHGRSVLSRRYGKDDLLRLANTSPYCT